MISKNIINIINTIFDLKLLENDEQSFTIYVKCSRGTYIRSLGVDIAKKLNQKLQEKKNEVEKL